MDDNKRRGTLESVNSDWGTGDEASLPRNAEQVTRTKKISFRHRSKERNSEKSNIIRSLSDRSRIGE